MGCQYMIASFLNYISKEKRLSQHTAKAYDKDLNQLSAFLQEEFEITDPLEVEHVHLRSWIVVLSEQDLSPKSINRKIACLKSFYKYAQVRGSIKVNPAQQLKPLKTEKPLPSFVKEDEIIYLLEKMEFEDSFDGLRDRLIHDLLYSTGIRLSELIGIRTANVNRYDATIKVLGKRNKERIIPISQELLTEIGKYERYKLAEGIESDYLLVDSKGRQLYPMFIYRKVNQYLSEITSLSKKSPHVLRHTFATHLLNKGADIGAVKELLGHTSLAATQVYTHNSIEKLRSVFNQAHPRA